MRNFKIQGLFSIICMTLRWGLQANATSQLLGSCDFEEASAENGDSLCGYVHDPSESEDFFHWQLETDGVGHYMAVKTEDHAPGQKARLYSTEIHQQDTHCFTFQYHTEGGFTGNSTVSANSLQVYLINKESSDFLLPIWRSSSPEVSQSHRGWTTVQLSLTPTVYQIVFEAQVYDSSPSVIALDNVAVSNEACVSTPHFLRVGNKEVNKGQNATIQCLLWGRNLSWWGRNDSLPIVLQKSTGEEFQPNSEKVFDDHLSVNFLFPKSNRNSAGRYRCISHNDTSVGVSNFARISLKIPPVPQRPPEVKMQGPTHLKVHLNSDSFVGDEPIVQTILKYRPISGLWSDVHEISGQDYHLWHLKPDTEYELQVLLVRPGPGGSGAPGPKLIAKTNCGVPLRPVQKVKFQPIASSQMKVSWQVPDFSVTQCHYHSYAIKYREYSLQSQTTNAIQYEIEEVGENSGFGIISGLSPFTKYQIKIELTNSEGSIETGEYVAMTGEGVPGPVPRESFIVTHADEASISLQWDKPAITNGILERYEVAYQGVSSFQPDFNLKEEDGLFQIRANEHNVTLSPLHPGTNYSLTIKAQTRAGFGPSIKITTSTKIAAPKMRAYPSPVPDSGSSSTPTTIEINILPAEANGAPISNYYIVVEEVPDQAESGESEKSKSGSRSKKKRKRNRKRQKRDIDRFLRTRRQAVVTAGEIDNPCYADPITYEDAVKQNKSFYFGGKLLPDDVTEETKFVVGEGTAAGGFSNPPLDPHKAYNIYVRVDSRAGSDTRANCVLVAIKASAPFETTTATSPATTIPFVSEGTEDSSDSRKPFPPGPEKDDRTIEEEELVDGGDEVVMYASIGVGVFIAALVVIIIVAVLLRRKRGKGRPKQKDVVVNPFEVRMMMSDMSTAGNNHSMVRSFTSPDRQALMMPDVVDFENHDFLEKTLDASGTRVSGTFRSASTPLVQDRPALRVDDFHIHVNDMKRQDNAGFREEFSSFREGQTAPWDVGKREENRAKNRYGNIMAYDHSRVVLQPVKGQDDQAGSDYINASYVLGYKNPQMYIAAQAPAAETINDFWAMIWQEKCPVVVMVTNLVELGKRKSHKYWPDESAQYGLVKVSLTDVVELSDCAVRTFVMQQNGGYDVREVKQFHFTAWPDHGVPDRPTNILSFVRRVKSYEPPGQGPYVVHCSAGSGRTGCFIVIDTMLDMAREECVIDVYNTVADLRSRRVNMVQNEEQYAFVHEAILEALLCGGTLVPAPALRRHYDDLITVDQQTQIAPVQEEFETLNVMTPKLTDEECSVARLPRNRQRNRFMDVLPADRRMPYLVTPHTSDPESNYINAVFVDSYSKRDSFIVTQMPLPNTVVDFWRLVYDYNCSSVVMMNDETEHDQTCCQYWPNEGIASFGPFTVEMVQKEDEVDVVTRVFKLRYVDRPSEGYRLLQQFQLTNWPATQPVPFTRNAVLRVIQLLKNWQSECSNPADGRTIVHCVAGAGRSGTFIACYSLCAQLSREAAVDVFNIVQRLRNVRPQLVETLEQYRFCYEVGWDFADQADEIGRVA